MRAAACHPGLPQHAKGMCKSCYMNEWRESHPAYAAIKSRERYWRDPEAARRESREYAKAHPDKRRSLWSSWYARNKEVQSAKQKAARALNREEVLRAERLRYAVHAEQRRVAARIYRRDHPESKRASQHRRRARRMGAGVVRYRETDIFERDGWRCHICRRRVDPSIPRQAPLGATIDHLIPISAGGEDAPRNVALAHWICNVRRHTRGDVQLRLIA